MGLFFYFFWKKGEEKITCRVVYDKDKDSLSTDTESTSDKIQKTIKPNESNSLTGKHFYIYVYIKKIFNRCFFIRIANLLTI